MLKDLQEQCQFDLRQSTFRTARYAHNRCFRIPSPEFVRLLTLRRNIIAPRTETSARPAVPGSGTLVW